MNLNFAPVNAKAKLMFFFKPAAMACLCFLRLLKKLPTLHTSNQTPCRSLPGNAAPLLPGFSNKTPAHLEF